MLNISYSINLQTSSNVGETRADKSQDSINSVQQNLENTLQRGTTFKFEIELTSNEEQVINLSSLGISYVRCLLLKSSNQFGYSLLTSSETSSPYSLSRLVFLDFNSTPPSSLSTYKKPTIIKLQSPSATHPSPTSVSTSPTIIVQVVVIGEP